MTTIRDALPKSRKARAGLALALVALVFLLGRLTAPAGEATDDHDHDHDHDALGEADGEDEQIYYCSMHPDQQSTDPDDTCPICGMDLVPMPDDGDPEEADQPILRVGIGDRAAALLNVEVAPVERRGARAEFDAQGHVEAAEPRLHDVVVRSGGFVEAQQAEHKWQRVRRGEPLASIYSPDVTAAARELLVIQRRGEARGESVSIESGKEKLRRLGAPESYIDEVLETGEVPRTYTLNSPTDGVITEIDGREGHAMEEGERHVQIADLSSVWVQLQAYEHELEGVEVGQPVEVRARAYPGRVFEGEIDFIDPAVDRDRRTARARLEIENPDGDLKPGMYVRGNLAPEGESDADADGEVDEDAPLVIPRSAPLLTGNRAVVYVQERDDDQLVYEGRDVELGGRAGEIYRVQSGLEEGELVVARGAFRIDSELQIRGRPSMMTPGEVFARGEKEEEIGATLAELGEDDVSEAFASDAGAVMDRYFELTAALADDDLGGAQQASLDMQSALGDVDAGDLAADAAEAWEDVSLELTGPLAQMEGAGNLDDFREALEPMAPPAERLAAFLESAAGLEVYRGTCPMTPSGEGHWLQPDDDIKNPYMGHDMLTCGTIDGVSP